MLTFFSMSFTCSRSLFGLVLATCLWSSPVHAQDAGRAEASLQVQTHLGIYVTRPERRDEGERVYVRRKRVEAWLMRKVAPLKFEEAVCDGARWLLTGRLKASIGVGGLFTARPDAEEVSLIFYDVRTRVDPDGNGRYRQRRSVEPQMRFTVTRERFAQLDAKALEAQLTGAECAQTARVVLDEVWVKPTDAR